MGTGNNYKTDLYTLNNYVQNSAITHPKELFIDNLREFFGQDSYYHYQRDQWGFPKTPEQIDLPQTAGLHDNQTTRLFIGEPYRFDIIYYPALVIRNAGTRSIPISMSRDKETIQYTTVRIIDGYGNEKLFSTPSHFVQAGAWEGQITVEVVARSPRARDELTDLVCLAFVDTMYEELKLAGVVVKATNAGTPNETDDRNDKLFKQLITFDIRSEWRRMIPIRTIIDRITFCVDFGNVANPNRVVAANLRINDSIDLVNSLLDV